MSTVIDLILLLKLSARCPFGKMSFRHDVFRQDVLSARCISARCPFGMMSLGWVSSGKVGGHDIYHVKVTLLQRFIYTVRFHIHCRQRWYSETTVPSLLKSNGCMKPSKLQEHLRALHPENVVVPQSVFETKRARFELSGTLDVHGYVPGKKPQLKASFCVALKIAKEKKPHTIAETLIKPCAIKMVELVCGNDAKQKIAQIPLSNDTIHDRIRDMSLDILRQVVEQINASPEKIGLQLDETTDVSNCAQLIVFVRYVYQNGIKDEFLFCDQLKQTTKAVDVFPIMNNFLILTLYRGTLWSICTDGAPVMLEKKSGLISLVKKVNPNVVSSHCILHQHGLASKTLPSCLKSVLEIVVKVVNFIRARALNHRVFKTMCQEMNSEPIVLLLHTEVRWLSRGKVLARVFELRESIEMFLRERNSDFLQYFEDPNFIISLAYLADIFGILNSLKISLQGRGVTILEAEEKIKSFQEKLALCERRVISGSFANFPLLEEITSNPDHPVGQSIQTSVIAHLKL